MTFMLLAAEMATFCLLVAPLPHAIRKKLFHFLSESPAVAKLAYGLKITFMYAQSFDSMLRVPRGAKIIVRLFTVL